MLCVRTTTRSSRVPAIAVLSLLLATLAAAHKQEDQAIRAGSQSLRLRANQVVTSSVSDHLPSCEPPDYGLRADLVPPDSGVVFVCRLLALGVNEKRALQIRTALQPHRSIMSGLSREDLEHLIAAPELDEYAASKLRRFAWSYVTRRPVSLVGVEAPPLVTAFTRKAVASGLDPEKAAWLAVHSVEVDAGAASLDEDHLKMMLEHLHLPPDLRDRLVFIAVALTHDAALAR